MQGILDRKTKERVSGGKIIVANPPEVTVSSIIKNLAPVLTIGLYTGELTAINHPQNLYSIFPFYASSIILMSTVSPSGAIA